MDILDGLNPAQKEAVEAINGPVLILAGPGSGKTRVITHRVAYLIRVVGVNPRSIMAVTFTNKAAREMEERLNRLVSASVRDLTLGTFHAICARILRQDGKAIGVDKKFSIYDDDDQISLIKRSLQDLALDPKQFAPRALQSVISSAKSQMQEPSDLHGKSYFDEVTKRVYERYQRLLTDSAALDFDDLLLKTVLLFRQNPKILERYQQRYMHIQVDEFQDTNLVQYELVKQLAGKYRNVCVVGDPDQSIYSWRAADIRNILNFEKDFPDAKVILLEQNYRSTQLILDAATHVISANKQRKPKELWTENEKGLPPNVIETYSAEEEAQWVVSEIDKLVRSGEAKSSDCAVMYRTNAQSRALEEAFIRYGMPYKLVAGTRFYERREVKDVIAYLRLIQNPYDTVSLRRVINVPQRGIGERSLDELTRWAESQGVNEYKALQLLAQSNESSEELPFSARTVKVLSGFAVMIENFIEKSRELDMVKLFDHVVEKSGYKQYITGLVDGEDRWENVMELRGVAQDYRDLPPEEGLTALLEGVALVSDVDDLPEKVDTVTLITLHQAKGLEFPVVFIIGMEEGILPHYKSIDDPAQLEEERRLCYVGITRAKQKVYLVRAFRRHLMGSSTVNKPSRFLLDIPPELIERGGVTAKEDEWIAAAEAKEKEIQLDGELPEFKAGDHVRHDQFGEGVVVNYRKTRNDAEVVVAFDGEGVKRFLLSFAKIEKV
ncbi:MAG: UvrD-helicase domain-containing protein [Dehalococcoidales bacterium]|nr:UvrD-helicase domain-containing protein [Dehalococcoidales bacterium]